jgi:hypothetical protein
MKAQAKSIRLIAEAVKLSKSFVHKTCKNSGPQTLEIFQPAKTSRSLSLNQKIGGQV